MQVRVVHADGSVAADVPLQDVPANSYAEWIRPAADGSWRVQTYSRDDGTEDLWRFEDDGSATSSRSGRGLYSPQVSLFGLLAQYPLDADGSMGLALLDADTLADTAEFEVWTGRPIGLNPWLILDDGTVYGTIQRSPDGPEAIARYSAPGAAPSNVVFRDAFD